MDELAEFAENPICKAALAAGRDFMTARDGRRAEKVLVDGAREKVGEMGELSREMDELSLLDEAGDMRGTTIEHYLGDAEEFYPDEHPQILEREVGYIFPLMEVEPTICIELKDEG